MKRILFAVAAAFVNAGAAFADEIMAVTPSGRSEAVFVQSTAQQASERIVNHCMDLGWMVVSSTSSQIVCEVPMGAFQSAITQTLLGNSYSTTPQAFVRIGVAQVGEHSRAQAQGWVETQMAFGQTRQMQFTDAASQNNFTNFLLGAGGQWPVGTSFPNYAYLGLDNAEERRQVGRRDSMVFRVTGVDAGSPAGDAGIQVGDVILKVNDRAMRDANQYWDIMRRLRLGETYPVLIERNGAEVTVSVVARNRPTITQLTLPAVETEAPPPTEAPAESAATP